MVKTAVPMLELAKYHRQIEKIQVADIKPNPDNQALMKFNGYYTLNTAEGAFFAIDANMLIKNGSTTPVYFLDLIVSLDGKTSNRYPFTGTFDGTKLVQPYVNLGGADFNLTFTRTDRSEGTTATCSGSISLQGKSAVTVIGSTYNNPIPSSLYVGKYYFPENKVQKNVMSIEEDYKILYDNGKDGLQPVSTYVYNLNMYYFSFVDGSDSVSLIMGTAAEKGFACNNMIVDKASNTVNTRSLLTIPTATMAPFELNDITGNALAGFSGYYPLKSLDNTQSVASTSSLTSLAFLSVQAQYVTANEAKDYDVYQVMISVSLDGVTSKGYYFDSKTMTFENNTLTMKNESITLTFNREYNSENDSLVTITGSIMGHKVTGYTLFNPVPLTVFGGVTMTNKQGDTLTVTNNNQVIYNGVTMNSIIYVPLMYILAYPIIDTTTVMSFGTDGLKGNTCIITNNLSGTPVTSVVYAIPDAN